MTPHEEGRKILELEQELERSFPQVPVDKVRTAVEQAWMKYLHAPVRDFVPLLVRREVGDWLRHAG
ncbi:MAG: three-helix bundle dimerization domain-containing protein [Acidimicrobiales bacterium]